MRTTHNLESPQAPTMVPAILLFVLSSIRSVCCHLQLDPSGSKQKDRDTAVLRGTTPSRKLSTGFCPDGSTCSVNDDCKRCENDNRDCSTKSCKKNGGSCVVLECLTTTSSTTTSSSTPASTTSSTTTSSATTTAYQPNIKSGLIIGGKAVEASAEHFSSTVSWFYNYKQAPLGWQGAWAESNNIEFVPMFSKDWLNNPDGSIFCRFNSTKYNDGLPECTTQDAIDVIGNTVSSSTNVVPKYILGFNEMYNNDPPEDMTPEEAAFYWAKYVEPAADSSNLILVSPTLNAKDKATTWFSDFLKRCLDETGCDIFKIEKFAIHQYDCRESLWHDWYEGDNSLLRRDLTSKLGSYGNINWDEYLQGKNSDSFALCYIYICMYLQRFSHSPKIVSFG